MSEEASDLRKRSDGWFRIHVWWQRLYWLLVIWIGGGSALAASGLFSRQGQQVFSLSIAVAAAILTTTKPNEQAAAYRRAWLRLDQQLKRSAGLPEAELQALNDGENFITTGVRTFTEADNNRLL